MVPETLKALAEAGVSTLRRRGLPVTTARIASLRARDLKFPFSAKLDIRNGSTHQLHLGADAELGAHLAQHQGEESFAELCQEYLVAAIERLPTPRPFGDVHVQTGGPGIVGTRGVRSFVARFITEAGSLFAVGDLISRCEYEVTRDTDYEPWLGEAYLPANLQASDEIAGKSAVDNLLVYLRKMESDIQLEVDGPEQPQLHNGVILGRSTIDKQAGLVIAADLPATEEVQLDVGAAVTVHAGVRGRHVEWSSQVLGRANRDVGADVLLACLVIVPPERIRADQRRKAFRITPTLRIAGELERLAPAEGKSEAPAAPAPPALVQVEDISFTGACLSAPLGELRALYAVGDSVRCRMVFPGLERVASMTAVVRRADTAPSNRNERHDILGIEFQVTDVACRRDLEFIRDYVLSEQRSLLARRVHVLGSS